MTKKLKTDDSDDGHLPTQYLNNENPYAFRKNYEANLSSIPANKERLNTLHRLQPQKLSVKFDPKSLDAERKYLLEEAMKVRRMKLVEEGFAIIKQEPIFEKRCEDIFEQHIENERILEILIELKKMNLIYHQMRLRARVSHVLSTKITENNSTFPKPNEKVDVDNIKESLIYTNLGKYYEEESTDQ
ncbi:hypothetical protein NUSPORA_00126 [Nucleospora cyclopteri]